MVATKRRGKTRRSVKKRQTKRSQTKRRQRGGVRKWVFDKERVRNEFLPKFADVNSGLLPDGIGGLEPDNTRISDNEIELGGAVAGGSADACKFILDPDTGVITFEDEEEQNKWLTTQADIINVLDGYKTLMEVDVR